MKNPLIAAVLAGLLAGTAAAQIFPAPKIAANFAEARKGFRTEIGYLGSDPTTLPAPPKGVFDLVRYPSQAGLLGAYVTPDPGDGKKHPAIVWITGGESNALGEMWEPRPRDNDQSAAAYRKAGVVLMTPTLRGGNDNPGKEEAYYGEVDDVLAAADHLAALPYVDPTRIYLGGHSTGGTLAVLVAEASPRFRAVFAFGPVSGVLGAYSGSIIPKELSKYWNKKEGWMRTPAVWLESVTSPLFIIEAKDEDAGNAFDLKHMDKQTENKNIRFILVDRVDHFSVLAPANEVIAKKILADNGPVPNLSLSAGEISRAAR